MFFQAPLSGSRSPHISTVFPALEHPVYLPLGKRDKNPEFRRMATEHQTWIADLFSDLSPKDVRELMRLLAKTKASASKAAQKLVAKPANGKAT